VACARISRRRPGSVPRPALYRALQRAGRGDVRGPDLRKRDTVLAAVKAWPAQGGACGKPSATAILDCGCARCHWADAGRDEETALRSNKETDLKEAGERGFSRCLTAKPSRGVRRFQTGKVYSTQKRTIDVLPKADILKSYRQLKPKPGSPHPDQRLVHGSRLLQGPPLALC
jgi:hypothetical protein